MSPVLTAILGLVGALLAGILGNWVYTKGSGVTVSRRMRGLVIGGIAVATLVITIALAPDDTASAVQRGAATYAPGSLLFSSSGSVTCDGTAHELLKVDGAQPGERITFDQAVEPPISPQFADDHGQLSVLYACDAVPQDQSWIVRATAASGRSGQFQVFAPGGTPRQLGVILSAATVPCDNTTHHVGDVTGAAPGETVTFAAANASSISGGTADADGAVQLVWSCKPGEAGTNWTVDASSERSGSVQFLLQGGTTPSSLEVTPIAANTWTDYRIAGGRQGASVPPGVAVAVQCRLEGFTVADGNTWWYRLDGDPWNGEYYVSADAFFNNGRSSGSLMGTPFVDVAVPLC